MNCKTLFFSTIYLLFTSASLQAESIKHIYEVSLPVVSQENMVRRAAFEQGLVEVSVRVSGTGLAPTQLDLSQASRMIRQYRYRTLSADEISEYMKKSGALLAPKYKLWMQFDDEKIKLLLRENGLPIWGHQRPNVLVWLAVKDGRNRYVLKRSDQSEIRDAVDAEAQKRGLPVIWPEYDNKDRKIVEFSDVWGQFWGPVKQASKRYGVDAIILGRMNWVNQSWQVNWSLLLEDKMDSWQLNALDLGLLTSSGIGVATDHISSRFAVFSDSANDAELIVRISNLDNVKQYARASHYLSSLAPVKNVYATEVKQHQVDFFIELSGDEDDLKRIIALGRVLEPDRSEAINAIEPPRIQTVTTPPVPPVTQVPQTVPVLTPNDESDDTQMLPALISPLDKKPETRILNYRMNG